jgi:hypothetical protein
MAVWSGRGRWRLLTVRTGEVVREWTSPVRGRTVRGTRATISADGTRIVVRRFPGRFAVDSSLFLLDAGTGRQLSALSIDSSSLLYGPFPLLALSADGQVVATREDTPGQEIKVRAAPTWKVRLRVDVSPHVTIGKQTMALALSTDGRLLAMAYAGDHGRAIEVWDTVSGRQRGQMKVDAPVCSLAFSRCGRVLASGDEDGGVSLWELAAMTRRDRRKGHRDAVRSVAFSGDGRVLASGSDDTTVVVWAAWPSRSASSDLSALWDDLASRDATTAFRAALAWRAAGAGGVRQLEARVQPASVPGSLARLIRELGSDRFAVRERAGRELAAVVDVAEPALRQALRRGSDLEQQARIRRLLGPLERGLLTTRQLRELRVVELLEQLGSPEAIRLLARLQRGADGALLTRQARSALARLAGPVR